MGTLKVLIFLAIDGPEFRGIKGGDFETEGRGDILKESGGRLKGRRDR